MSDQEWFQLFPVSVFHGVAEDPEDGTILARMYNPLVHSGIYRVEECGLYDGAEYGRYLHNRCPQNTRRAAEIAVEKEALRAVQAEKVKRGIPLQRPRIDDPPALTVIPGGLEPD